LAQDVKGQTTGSRALLEIPEESVITLGGEIGTSARACFDGSPASSDRPGGRPRPPDIPRETQRQAQIPALVMEHLPPGADGASPGKGLRHGTKAELRQNGLRHLRATDGINEVVAPGHALQ